MLMMLLLIFAGAVMTVLFWATAIAVAVAIFELLSLAIRGVFWLITRPIVWFVIMPLRFIFGDSATHHSNEGGGTGPSDFRKRDFGCVGNTASDKLSQLTTLNRLRENNTITTGEYEKLKADLLRS